MKKLLMSLCLLTSFPLMASTVYTSESVDYKNIRAYRSLSSCLNWYHMPAQFDVLEAFLDYPRLTKISIPQTTPKATGYGYFVDLHFGPQWLDNADEFALKKKIATFVNNIVNRNRTDKKYAHYADCPSNVDPHHIVLNRLLVRNQVIIPTLESSLNSVKPNSVIKLQKSDSIDVITDSYNPINLTLLYDLSNPDTQRMYEETFKGHQKVIVGQSRFMIHGKERIYDASLTLKGELSAKWVSELTTVDCKNSSSSSNTTLAGMVGLPNSSFIPTMSNFGFSGGGVGLEQNKEVSVCLQKLLTRMADAKSELKFEFELDRNDKLGNKFVTICENGECHQIPLENWIKITLLDLWVKSNFHVISKEIADRTFEPIIKPSGNTLAKLHQTVSLGENYILDVDIATPVVVSNVVKEYPYANSESERMKCFWNNFELQAYTYDLDPKTSLIPITRECLELRN